ncbi:PQQ-binding-like beta-propeller repeat protein [Luteitalea sp.]|uniref:outer membrane protein assembly factor BamB family protein n=1 Tax=Luteitalea sp. TaxID=2004800 RepID=UPI0037CB3722
MRSRLMLVTGALALAVGVVPADAQSPRGKRVFETRCANCHGGDGNGGEMGPAITTRLPALTDADVSTLVRLGRASRGMPAQAVPQADMAALLRHLRAIQRTEPPLPRRAVETTAGDRLEGELLGEGLHDLQLRTADGAIRLLRKHGGRVREVTSDEDWPGYNGGPGGNRFTTLDGITPANVARLAPQWMTTLGDAGSLQVTPVVVGGIMYVTAPNECVALDAGTGRRLWRFKRPRTTGVSGGWANRGVAVAGRRVFLMTDAAHVIALDRFTGAVLWDTTLADFRQNYSATSAPLVAGDHVITGVSGGEHGANGFVVAVDQATGKEAWRFHTVPRPGEPGSETWQGKDILHGGAPTWFTGSYDPELDLVYWPTGNPSKEYDGSDRKGDNLYASCILALDRRTGRLRWHYQFTPHDLWDWDATQTSVIADLDWHGAPRKVLIHADRNGFFYVFDRVTGERLLSTPFVKHLTWATGIAADGRPQRVDGQEPSPAGTRVCPSQDGATNWFSPSFDPATSLYFVQVFEKCSVYTTRPQGPWKPGETYLGGTQRTAPDPVPQRLLRAIDVRTGAIRWEMPQPGPGETWGGTLATATGLVFVAEEGGAFSAVEAATGRRLWSFPTNQGWKASPMTYRFDGRQYVAIAAGATILSFAVQE